MADRDGPILLAGGNPQIPKGDGAAPVQAYLDAMPGWKGDIGRQLDALVVSLLPDVQRAVRWNSPFYGLDGRGWFLSLHCFTKYVKVTFLNGALLDPPPPIPSKQGEVRYYHVSDTDPIDEALLTDWVRQAASRDGAFLF